MTAYLVILAIACAGVLLTGRALVPFGVLMVNLAYKLFGWAVGLEDSYPYIDGFTLFALILTAPRAPFPETDRCARTFATIIFLHFSMCLFPKIIVPLGLWTDTLGSYAVSGYTLAYQGLFFLAVLTLWGNESARQRVVGALRWCRSLLSVRPRVSGFGAVRQASVCYGVDKS